jgi:hypothetical protein
MLDRGWQALLWGQEDMEEDGGGAASLTSRAGWDGMSICDQSLPEPSAKEAPPWGGSGGGHKVSMGDNVGGAASPTARVGFAWHLILGYWLARFDSTFGLPYSPFGLVIGWALSARFDLRLRRMTYLVLRIKWM